MRWTTAVGITIGGVGGALAALLGSPQAPPPTPSAASVHSESVTSAAPVAAAPVAATPAEPLPTDALERASPAASAVPSSASPAASAAPVEAPAAADATKVGPAPAVALEPPTTREGLMKAMLFCDQKKDFDECGRVASALEQGTAGAADPSQAKRFRRIALTHLVAQCETGVPHACFVLAAKYRAGTELAASPASAEVLEKRALGLCRLRSAPECPEP